LNKIEFTPNLFIVLFVFIAYALIGFLDDYLSIKRKLNKGLTEVQKLFFQLIIAVIFFYIFMSSGGNPVLEIFTLNIKIDMGWLYGFFILFILVGSSNAVNITDGLDGLAGGLSTIAFLTFGIISWGSGWVEGYQEMAILCFILSGALLGFLLYNTYPAKVFMGDTGSLALGATLATIAILTDHELTLVGVAGVFVIETLVDIIQIISVKYFGKKIFLMAPLHHHFEKLGWAEQDIVKLFWVVGFLLGMAGIAFGVWI
jgi:phospho-N-acetylmuramoyl-pentapeptide-transferase